LVASFLGSLFCFLSPLFAIEAKRSEMRCVAKRLERDALDERGVENEGSILCFVVSPVSCLLSPVSCLLSLGFGLGRGIRQTPYRIQTQRASERELDSIHRYFFFSFFFFFLLSFFFFPFYLGQYILRLWTL
jgi:hypothetical protein